MLQVESLSVWLVIACPCTVKLLKCTPLMFTEDDSPCRLIVFLLTSDATFVKYASLMVAVLAAVLQVAAGLHSDRSTCRSRFSIPTSCHRVLGMTAVS